MPISASTIMDAWPEISARLPSGLNLDELARKTNAIRRLRGDGIGSGEVLLRLCLAHGPGGMSLPQTAAWARINGLAELTGQSLNERLHRSAGFLGGILHRLLAARPPAKPRLWSGRCLRIADGSSLSQPGSKGTDWRLHGVYDLENGGFSHLEVTDRKGAESLLRAEPAAGEVLIADRGYAKAKELLACLDPAAAGQRDFIVRIGWKALALQDAEGGPFSLIGQLEKMTPDTGVKEWTVQAIAREGRQARTVPLRLIAVPLPADKAEAARLRTTRAARKHQDKTDPRSLTAAGFAVLATSLPADIPACEICAVYRMRWQIELAFKRLKSLLHIDGLPTRTEAGSKCWLYAQLIAILLTEDLCQDFLAFSP